MRSVMKFGKVKSQTELSGRFFDIMTHRQEKYHKNADHRYIRKAEKGETITTTLLGVKEAEVTVKDDNHYVVCGQVEFEMYTLTTKEFIESCYTDSPSRIKLELPQYKALHKKGFKQYRSRREILAHKVINEDMEWFRSGMDREHNENKPVFFTAPVRNQICQVLIEFINFFPILTFLVVFYFSVGRAIVGRRRRFLSNVIPIC